MTKFIPQTPTELQVVYPESEVSLTDLGIVLYRRRRLILFFTIACVVLAAAYVSLRPKIYAYTTTVEIGSMINDEDGKKKLIPLEPSKSVLAKLEQAYIPAVTQELRAKDANSKIVNIRVSAPKDTELVVLESKGGEEEAVTNIEAQKLAVQKLVEDHQRRLVPIRIEYEHALNDAKMKLQELSDANTVELKKQKIAIPLIQEKIKLERLKDADIFGATKKNAEDKLRVAQIKLEELEDPRIVGVRKQGLEEQIERAKMSLRQLESQYEILGDEQKSIDTKAGLLKKQIETLNDQLSIASENRQKILDGSSGSTAMTVMLVDNEIQQNRNRLGELEERLYVTLPDSRRKLDADRAENLRNQASQRTKVSAAELELTKFLADNDREIEKQKMVAAQLQRSLDTLVTENRMEQAALDPVVSELSMKARNFDPDHMREVAQQQQLVAELEEKLNNLRETHLVVAPMQSVRPTGQRAVVILAIALLIGLVGAIMASFLLEFVGHIKESIQRDKISAERNNDVVSVTR